jgi:peptidoglycan/LPS O-acetylase OafA/YrhL
MTNRASGTRNRYIMGLDGIRGLAVIAVVAYHLAPAVVRGGFIGVDIFFVISGFLITTLLISEYREKGRINFSYFWLRRARRLLPALIATICITSSIALFIGGDVLVGLGRQILGALTFSSNWTEIAAGSNYFSAYDAHLFSNLWSLAVEEQFYLVWPFIVFAWLSVRYLLRRPKWGMWFGMGLALTSALLMAVMFQEQAVTRVYYGTDTHVFGLMIGVALAFWRYATFIDVTPKATSGEFVPRRSLSRRTFPVQLAGLLSLAGLVFLLFMLPDQNVITYRGGLLLVSVLSAVVIAATFSFHGALRKIFTWPALVWVGVRSYGIYLWHWPIIVLLHYGIPGEVPTWTTSLITTIATLTIATVSYKYLEVPIQAYGFIAFFRRGIRREIRTLNNSMTEWRTRPHLVLIVCLVIVALTGFAVIRSPDKTQAQKQIEAGQATLRKAAATRPSNPKKTAVSPVSSSRITGTDMTLIGDSVALASVPALHERFPGIFVDAAISRSLRQGGFETIDTSSAAGNLRKIVIIALGTNGYYGTGNLETLMKRFHDRKVIFVTAHGLGEWVAGNNQYVRDTATKYPNVYIAEWDTAITAHPEKLGPDGTHPSLSGGVIYADAIAKALTKIKL